MFIEPNWSISLLILLASIDLLQIYWYWVICSPISADIKTVSKAGKNAWTSDFKWCNYIICPLEGSPLFNN